MEAFCGALELKIRKVWCEPQVNMNFPGDSHQIIGGILRNIGVRMGKFWKIDLLFGDL